MQDPSLQDLPNGRALQLETGAAISTPSNRTGGIGNSDANGGMSSCDSKLYTPRVPEAAVQTGAGPLLSGRDPRIGTPASVGQKRRMSKSPPGEAPAKKVGVL